MSEEPAQQPLRVALASIDTDLYKCLMETSSLWIAVYSFDAGRSDRNVDQVEALSVADIT
jgi:hypothetical protein